jgi:predicted nucleic acid-binding protein
MEQNPKYLAVVREVFRQVDTGAILGFTGMVSFAEVLVKPKSVGNTALEAAYQNILFYSRNFTTTPIDAAVAECAAELRSRHKIKLPDALQVAFALESGCDVFLSNDSDDLRKITEIAMLFLDDLEL